MKIVQLIKTLKFNPLKLMGSIFVLLIFFLLEIPKYQTFTPILWLILPISMIILIVVFSFISIFLIFKLIHDLSIFTHHKYIKFLMNDTSKRKTLVPIFNQFYTMVFEELIFRYLLFYFLELIIVFPNQILPSDIYSIIISSVIFSLYHFHIYFTTKQRILTLIFISLSFLLGLILSVCYFYFGLIPCIFIHFISIDIIYRIISKKICNSDLNRMLNANDE